jgi:hypothetical protein
MPWRRRRRGRRGRRMRMGVKWNRERKKYD